MPPPGSVVTAGFSFDVPVRFDTDKLEINVLSFRHGAIPSIPVVEIRLPAAGGEDAAEAARVSYPL